MSNSTTDSASDVKAQVQEQLEELLRGAEIPASFITLSVLNNGDSMLVSLDVPHTLGNLLEVAYLVDSAFADDVKLYSISECTCEYFAVTLRVNVPALLAVEQEEAA